MTPHLTEKHAEELAAILGATFAGKVVIERLNNPVDDADGFMLLVDNVVGVWPTTIKLGKPKYSSITSEAVYKWPGYIVDSYDNGDGEPLRDEQHETWEAAVADVVKRLAVYLVEDFYRSKADAEAAIEEAARDAKEGAR